MGLNEYRKKRDFTKTPEPTGEPGAEAPAPRKRRSSAKAPLPDQPSAPASKGGAAPAASADAIAPPVPPSPHYDAQARRAIKQHPASHGGAPIPEVRGPVFVVQKHAASSLHYDLRLRVGDVLRSWAVPKGPSLDPREKRLAVETEDHPLEYATFEGVIPSGEYGGGTMMVWDCGEWSPESDARAALREGLLKFRLDGTRLRGRWMLVRLKDEKQWLLVKERDAEANPAIGAETFATSVLTGRTMDEIASGAPARQNAGPGAALRARDLAGARAAPMPSSFKPQLAIPAEHALDGDDWLHEVKFDGYRLLFFRKGDSVKAHSRSGLDWTSKVPDLASAIRDRVTVDAVLDGEAVILDTRGVSDFQALQNAIHNRRSKAIVYFAFDLPWCDGFDLTRSPLDQRRALLRELVGSRQEGRLRFSEHVRGSGPQMLESVRAHGLEGIVSKRAGSVYTQARAPSWIKVKCFNQQEFVVAGFSAPEGTREELGALLLGYYDDQKRLRFCGKVGTGFSAETLKKLGMVLRERIQPKPAFFDPPTGAEARGVTWIRPDLVAQVQFRDWSNEGLIRHNSFRGLREDRDPTSVTREIPEDVLPQRHADTAEKKEAEQESDPRMPETHPPMTNARSSKKATKTETGPGIISEASPGTTNSRSAKKTKAANTGTASEIIAPHVPTAPAPGPSPSSSSSSSSPPPGAPVVNSPAIRLTNPDRIVFPDRGAGYTVTKRQLAEYYELVAPLMLPHVADRPLAIQRCPDGEGSKAFFQKHPAAGMPSAIRGTDVTEPDGSTERHLMITDAAGLVGLVQMNALEIHPWGSRASDPDRPDRLIFDLDPGEGVSWRTIVEAAIMVRDALKQVKLTGFVRTTGGKGLHVVIPIKPVHTWDAAHAFCRAVADALVKLAPRRFVSTSIKEQRAGRVYIDYLRNLRGSTAVGPYSTRARPGGPVALPIGWDELSGIVSPGAFNIYSVATRVKAGSPDPWAGIDAAAGVLA